MSIARLSTACCLMLVVLLGATGAPATADEAPTLTLEQARPFLKQARLVLRDRSATEEDLRHTVAELERVSAQLADEPRHVLMAQRTIVGLLDRAVMLQRTDPRTKTRHDRAAINQAAARALGTIGATLDDKSRQRLARMVQRTLTLMHDRREPEAWNATTLDTLFQALAAVGEPSSISWILDEHVHTKRRELPFLRAAQKSLLGFENVPGRLRQEVVKTIVKTYAGVEARARRNDGSPADRSSKELWDALREDTIPLLQRYAGEPRNEKGEALSTVQEFQRWQMAHKNPRKAPWAD